MKLTAKQIKKLADAQQIIQGVYLEVLTKHFPIGENIRRKDVPKEDIHNCFRVVGYQLPTHVIAGYDGIGVDRNPDSIDIIYLRRLDTNGRVYGETFTSWSKDFWNYYVPMASEKQKEEIK